jgi:predicted protein tyrosine phosphatase
MKKIIILGKLDFDKTMEYSNTNDSNVEEKDIMYISICSPQDDDQPYIAQLSRESYFKEEHSNVKIMYFGDYLYPGEHSFTEEQAKELYEFIKENKDKSMAIIHCGAGISRSAAIGTFIFDFYGETTFEEFKRDNPRIHPNFYIYKLLKEQYEKDK